MEIAKFAQTDQPAIAAFWISIYEEMNWPVKYLDGFDDIPAYFGYPHGFLLTVKDKQQLIGCGGIKPLNQTTGIIKRFYIVHKHRGQGVAAKLLQNLITESKQRHLNRLVLDVHFKNTRAIKFYEKHGFSRYTQLPNPHWPESQNPDKFFYYQQDISDQ